MHTHSYITETGVGGELLAVFVWGGWGWADCQCYVTVGGGGGGGVLTASESWCGLFRYEMIARDCDMQRLSTGSGTVTSKSAKLFCL